MAWSHTQTLLGADGSVTSATTVALTLGATVSASALVVGTVVWGSDTITITGITDDKSNTYTVIDSLNSTGDSTSFAQFYKEGISNGPITITVTFSATVPFRRICVSEYAGIAISAAIDTHTSTWQNVPGTSANILSSGAVTTTAAGNLIRGAFFDTSGTGNVLSAGTSPNAFTQRANGPTGNNIPCEIEDFLQAAAGSIAATAGQSNNHNMLSDIITFKIAASDTLFGSKRLVMM